AGRCLLQDQLGGTKLVAFPSRVPPFVGGLLMAGDHHVTAGPCRQVADEGGLDVDALKHSFHFCYGGLPRAHTNRSRIALPALSWMGGPVAGAVFSLAGSRPRVVRTVACTSSIVAGRTGPLSPSGSVWPITRPPRRPPPARARLNPPGQ